MGAPNIYGEARLNHARALCERIDFKRFISHEMGMDIMRPEDLTADDCFSMIMEYVGAVSPQQIDRVSVVTHDFIKMLEEYEQYRPKTNVL